MTKDPMMEELSLAGKASASQTLTPEMILEANRVTPKTPLTPMEHLFLMYGKPCFFRGELTAHCGKAKSGKTLFLSILMACTMKDKVLALERSIQPLRVLWIDTEQSKQSTQDIQINRIMPLAGLSDLCDDQFFAYNLRGLGYEMRRKLVELAIRKVQPDLVIIDGIKDLVTDINDAVQATLIMEQLMALAQKHHCCIVNVLHQNKSEADHNMRGSIGTELTNKAFEVYNCEYIEDRNLFRVSQRLSRRNRVKRKLCYRLNDDGLPVECPEVQDQPRDAQGRWTTNKSPTNGAAGSVLSMSPADLRKLFTDAMEGRRQRAFNELMAIALKRCGVVDAKAYYAYVSEAEEQGIIRKVVHPETGRTWVELIDNALPF